MPNKVFHKNTLFFLRTNQIPHYYIQHMQSMCTLPQGLIKLRVRRVFEMGRRWECTLVHDQ